MLSDRGRKDPWKNHLKRKRQMKIDRVMGDEHERNRKKHEFIGEEEFYEPKDKIPSLTADSELRFRNMMTQYNEANANHETDYFQMQGVYQDYFCYVMNHVKSYAGHQYERLP